VDKGLKTFSLPIDCVIISIPSVDFSLQEEKKILAEPMAISKENPMVALFLFIKFHF
jgi:hypothetical protein